MECPPSILKINVHIHSLGDGENEATILHWTLWESALNAYCSEVQRPITPIFTL